MHTPLRRNSLACTPYEDQTAEGQGARVPLKSASHSALRCLPLAKADANAAAGAPAYLVGAPGAFMARQSPDWMKLAQKNG